MQNNIRKSVTVSPEVWSRVAAFRVEKMYGSESEAVRRLLLAGLAKLYKGPVVRSENVP